MFSGVGVWHRPCNSHPCAQVNVEIRNSAEGGESCPTVPVGMIGVMKLTRLTLGFVVGVVFAVSVGAVESPKKRLVVLDFDDEPVRDEVAAIFGLDLDVGLGMRDRCNPL